MSLKAGLDFAAYQGSAARLATSVSPVPSGG